MMFDRFVGLPWAKRGRGPEAFDCWGLFQHAFAWRGIALASYADAYVGPNDPAITGLVTTHRGEWMVVPKGQERPWDGILIKQDPWHVGIVVGGGAMLHMPRDGFSLIEPYTARNIARRIEGFYRYEVSS